LTIKGVIFDLGWTLLDFTAHIPDMTARRAADLGAFLRTNGLDVEGPAVFAAYEEEMRVLQEAGAELNYEYPARLAMLRALRRSVSRFDAARLAADALATSFESIIPLWQPYHDTLSTLDALRGAGYRLGCISNTNDGAHVQRMVDRNDLRRRLCPVYTSEEIGLRKPHPRIFRMLLCEWQLSPGETVMVGDTLNADVLGAHNVGMRGVWIDRGAVNPWSENEENRAIVPDAIIQRLGQLPPLLDGIWDGT
jgi:putative hydrolase of the HAD superfamily